MKLTIVVIVLLAAFASSNAQFTGFPPASFFQNILRMQAQQMLADPAVPQQYKIRIMQVLYMSSYNFNRCRTTQMPWTWFEPYCIIMTYAKTSYDLRDIYREWQASLETDPGTPAPGFLEAGFGGFEEMTQLLNG